MKTAVAFLIRFARKNPEQTDAFGQRLTIMTKPKTPRPTRMSTPPLFKNRVRAA
ncbi:hypothetical protein [Albidovulum sediminis]|uniref:Transposase n=1 Tax=Albidovulum sediminis TaxID=3066345 RepID=A0ABT2NQG9_9RHOB|nr:hypothetical protein [Defluviimonas sediminis]MCT8330209.1 hypothetical protein [Defluviimonas sediminis]